MLVPGVSFSLRGVRGAVFGSNLVFDFRCCSKWSLVAAAAALLMLSLVEAGMIKALCDCVLGMVVSVSLVVLLGKAADTDLEPSAFLHD